MSEERGVEAFTPEQRQRISTTILERLAQRNRSWRCSSCGSSPSEMPDGVVELVLKKPRPINPWLGMAETGRALHNVALVCTHCGHTHLYNLNVLGLGHLVVGPGR